MYTKNVGLYKDDGLAVLHQPNAPKIGRIRKVIITLSRSEGIYITIDTDFIETDFLDVSFNLEMGKCFPYRETNNTILYIHFESSHPPSMNYHQLQLPSMIKRQISNLSCNEN